MCKWRLIGITSISEPEYHSSLPSTDGGGIELLNPMPYLPNTSDDQRVMLDAIGVKSIDELFAMVPGELRLELERHAVHLD